MWFKAAPKLRIVVHWLIFPLPENGEGYEIEKGSHVTKKAFTGHNKCGPCGLKYQSNSVPAIKMLLLAFITLRVSCLQRDNLLKCHTSLISFISSWTIYLTCMSLNIWLWLSKWDNNLSSGSDSSFRIFSFIPTPSRDGASYHLQLFH